MSEQKPPETSEQDLRTRIISRIWGTMPAILALSIPLEAVTGAHGAIAITGLLAAGISTSIVWLRGGNAVAASPRLKPDESTGQKRIQELEERLASLESITNFEHKLIEAKYPGAAPVAAPVAPAFSLVTPPGGVMSDSGVQAQTAAARPIAQSG